MSLLFILTVVNHKKRPFVSTEEPCIMFHLWIYGFYLTIFCILSSATTKMKDALSLLCCFACFVLQRYAKG